MYIFLVYLFTGFANSQGINVSLNKKAIEALKDSYVPHLKTSVESFGLPDLEVPLSFMNVYLSNITVTKFQLSPSNVQITLKPETSSLNLVITNFTIELHAYVEYTHLFKFGGTIFFSITNSTLEYPLVVKKTQEGKLSVYVDHALGDLSSLEFRTEADSWVLWALASLGYIWPLDQLDNWVVSHVIKTVGNYINPHIQKIVDSLCFYSPIGSFPIGIDYHLTDFSIKNYQTDSSVKGQFFVKTNPSLKPPFVPLRYAEFQTNDTLRIQLTHDFFKSFFWSLHASDSFKVYIDSQKASESSPFDFSTKGLSLVVPELKSAYSTNSPVDLYCEISKTPQISIQTYISLEFTGHCDFIVRKNSKKAFRANLGMQAEWNWWVQNEQSFVYLKGKVKSPVFNQLEVTESTIGEVETLSTLSALNWVSGPIADIMNIYMQEGKVMMPLPEGLLLKQVHLKAYSNAIEVGATPDFSALLSYLK